VEIINFINMNSTEVSTETNELLKVNDTLKKLSIKSRVTLYWWAKSGYLVPIKVGKSLRYRLSDINALLNGDVPVGKTGVIKGGE